MKRIALSLLTAAISTTAFAPVAFAAPDFDTLRQENRDKSDKVDFDMLRQDNLEKGAVDFDMLRRDNLDKDAVSYEYLEVKGVDFDMLRRENLDKDAVDFDDLRYSNRPTHKESQLCNSLSSASPTPPLLPPSKPLKLNKPFLFWAGSPSLSNTASFSARLQVKN
jgi:pentapeptide MXKDX repeat protein